MLIGQEICHSTSGNLFVISGGAISWLSKKQPVVALLTTEAEYVALRAATQEVAKADFIC